MFPLVTYKDFPFVENMLKYDFMKYRHVCFIIELHQFTSGTPLYIPHKENKAYKFDHCTIAVIV
jgi:hypothetical protein